MSRRRKGAVWFVMGLCSVWGVSAFAQDANSDLVQKTFGLTVSGSDTVFAVQPYWQHGRAQVGPEFSYRGEDQRYGAELVVKYFAIDRAKMDLYLVKDIPTAAYIGLGIGGAWDKDWQFENAATGRAGMIFGDGPIRFGVGYLYRMDEAFWKGAENGEHEVRGEILIGVK